MPGSLATFGEGVFLTAAMLLAVSGQESLAKLLSIGNRLLQQKNTDLVMADEPRITAFLTAFHLVRAELGFAAALVRPSIRFAMQK
jgi:hypothetical protein